MIEHLRDPEAFLDELRKRFDFDQRTLVLTTPNVAFAAQRRLRDAGFRNLRVRDVPAPFPKVFGDGVIGRGLLAANLALIRVSPTWFSYQIFVLADSTAAVDFVLGSARRFHSLPPPSAPDSSATPEPAASSLRKRAS